MLRSHSVLISLVDLHELIGIVDLVLEQHERRELSGEVLADANDVQLRVLFIEAWVIHWEIDHLFVVHDGNQLGSSQEGFLVFDSQKIPLARHEVSDQDAI